MSEIPRSSERRTRKIDQAREAFRTTIRALSEKDGPYHVAIRVYGHRKKFPSAPGDRTDSDFANSPLGRRDGNFQRVKPYNDTQLVLSFVEHSLLKRENKIEEFLDPLTNNRPLLQPWGETPLYFSIVKGIEDIQNERSIASAASRHIVVITDGGNRLGDDRSAREEGVDLDISKAKSLLTRASASSQPIQLHVVGFDLSEADQRSIRPLEDVARLTGGGSYPASDQSGLIASLEKALGLARQRYRVARVEDSVASTEEILIGATKTLDQHPSGRKLDYRVVVEESQQLPQPIQAVVNLEGGEAIALHLEGSGLVHRRYEPEENRPTEENILDPSDSNRPYFVSALIPRMGDEQYDLRMLATIQNQIETQFSPRPGELWAQVTPLAAGSGQAISPAFQFYVPRYQVGTPVPVATFDVAKGQWPRGADRAEISLWFKSKATSPDMEERVAVAANRPLMMGEYSFATSIPPRRSATDPCQIFVTATYPDGTELDHVRVLLDPPPLQIRKSYYVERKQVKHIFTYEADYWDRVGETRIRLTSRASVQRNASAPKPLRVTVPREVWAGSR
jgi:hypothetical protein